MSSAAYPAGAASIAARDKTARNRGIDVVKGRGSSWAFGRRAASATGRGSRLKAMIAWALRPPEGEPEKMNPFGPPGASKPREDLFHGETHASPHPFAWLAIRCPGHCIVRTAFRRRGSDRVRPGGSRDHAAEDKAKGPITTQTNPADTDAKSATPSADAGASPTTDRPVRSRPIPRLTPIRVPPRRNPSAASGHTSRSATTASIRSTTRCTRPPGSWVSCSWWSARFC